MLEEKSMARFYWAIIATAITMLLAFTLTAYNKNLVQLGLFGVIYFILIIFGFVTWLFRTYVFHQDGEPYLSKFILSSATVIVGLFLVTLAIGAISKQWSFLATLQLGHGFLTPLASSVSNTTSTLLTFLMNVPGPVAEEAFFRVFLITAFMIAFGRGDTTKVGTAGKIMILCISSGSFGLFHWYAYGADIPQIIAAVGAGALLSFYFLWIQQSALVVTAGHFVYNFAVLLLSIINVTSSFTLITPYIALIPVASIVLYHYVR